VPAVVVHLGTMIGGHYIAYCLVDPERMFQNPADETNGVENLSLNGKPSFPATQTASTGSISKRKDRRVWCYCSE
jgi:ubiquitin carboxyl-terminal hydrolase 16/45